MGTQPGRPESPGLSGQTLPPLADKATPLENLLMQRKVFSCSCNFSAVKPGKSPNVKGTIFKIITFFF